MSSPDQQIDPSIFKPDTEELSKFHSSIGDIQASIKTIESWEARAISLPDATFATLVAEVSSIRQIYSKLLISTLTFVETGEALATEMHTLLSYLLTTSSGRGIATAPMLRAIVDKGAILEAVSQATTHQFLQLLEKLRGVREEMDRVHAKLSVRKRDIKAWYKNLHEIATVVLALGTGLAGMAVIGATGGLAVPIIVGVGAVLATATSVLGGVLQHRLTHQNEKFTKTIDVLEAMLFELEAFTTQSLDMQGWWSHHHVKMQELLLLPNGSSFFIASDQLDRLYGIRTEWRRVHSEFRACKCKMWNSMPPSAPILDHSASFSRRLPALATLGHPRQQSDSSVPTSLHTLPPLINEPVMLSPHSFEPISASSPRRRVSSSAAVHSHSQHTPLPPRSMTQTQPQPQLPYKSPHPQMLSPHSPHASQHRLSSSPSATTITTRTDSASSFDSIPPGLSYSPSPTTSQFPMPPTPLPATPYLDFYRASPAVDVDMSSLFFTPGLPKPPRSPRVADTGGPVRMMATPMPSPYYPRLA